MTEWIWPVAWLAFVWTVPIRWPRRVYRGLYSRLLSRLIFRTDTRELVALRGVAIRLLHINVWVVIGIFVWDAPSYIYWPVAAFPWIDDIITGDDDDRWKRRWEALKNKVKWLMKLPAPARVNPGTA